MSNPSVAPTTGSRPFPSFTPSRVPGTQDREGRRILSTDELKRFQQQGFLSITSLVQPRDIAEVRDILDRLFAQQGRKWGHLKCPLQMAPELKTTIVFRSCLAIAKQILGRTTRYACVSEDR